MMLSAWFYRLWDLSLSVSSRYCWVIVHLSFLGLLPCSDALDCLPSAPPLFFCLIVFLISEDFTLFGRIVSLHWAASIPLLSNACADVFQAFVPIGGIWLSLFVIDGNWMWPLLLQVREWAQEIWASLEILEVGEAAFYALHSDKQGPDLSSWARSFIFYSRLVLLQEANMWNTLTSSAPRALHLLSTIAAPAIANCTPSVVCKKISSNTLSKTKGMSKQNHLLFISV